MMKFIVEVIESERGWGSKVVDQIVFESADDAQKFVDEFNSRNYLDETPDWYMYCSDPVLVRSK